MSFHLLFSSIYYTRREYCNRENFRLPVFDGFSRLCLKYDLTIYTKCLSVCDTNFVATLAQKLMTEIA